MICTVFSNSMTESVGSAKVTVSGPAFAFAKPMASRSDPAPASAALVTENRRRRCRNRESGDAENSEASDRESGNKAADGTRRVMKFHGRSPGSHSSNRAHRKHLSC